MADAGGLYCRHVDGSHPLAGPAQHPILRNVAARRQDPFPWRNRGDGRRLITADHDGVKRQNGVRSARQRLSYIDAAGRRRKRHRRVGPGIDDARGNDCKAVAQCNRMVRACARHDIFRERITMRRCHRPALRLYGRDLRIDAFQHRFERRQTGDALYGGIFNHRLYDKYLW